MKWQKNKDTGKKTPENSTKKESDNPTDPKIPVIESDIIIPEQKIEKEMETHAQHLHLAPGKKIRHYFFEFLMLFLAAFCGFIAENWREQLQEHRREKEFIHSLVEDIKSDTLQSNRTLLQLKRIKSGIDSVLVKLSSPEIVNNTNDAYSL